jgi:O-antigen/teichoic acid export membrane protein
VTSTEAAPRREGTRILLNSAVQVAGVFGASLISLFTFVSVTRYLGPTAYGYYSAALAIVLIPSIVSELGLGRTVLRYIARRPEDTARVVSASVTARLMLGVVAFAVTLVVVWIAPFPQETRTATLIACAGSLLLLVNTGLLTALQAELRMHWAVLADMAGRALTLGLTLLALHEKLGLYAVVMAYVIGNALTLFIDFLGVSRRIRLHPVLDLRYCWQLARSSAVVGAALMAGSLYRRIDTVLLAAFRPAHEVGLYSAAYKFFDLSLAVITAVSVSIFAHLTRAMASDDPNTPVQRAFDVFLAIGACVAVVAFVHAEHLVTLASGPDFADAAPALQILAPAIAIAFVGATMQLVLLTSHRERQLLGVSASMVFANVALNVVLLPMYGYKAAAATTLVTEFLWLLLSARMVRRSLGLMPALSFVPHIVLAAGIMAVVLVFLPGPWLIADLVGILAFVSTLVLVPGPGWNYVVALLPPGMRRQRSALT